MALDFDQKVDSEIDFRKASREIEKGRFVWLDFDSNHSDISKSLWREIGLVNEAVLSHVLRDLPATYHRHDDCLHFSFRSCQLQGIHFLERRFHVILGAGFLVTVHRAPTRSCGSCGSSIRPISGSMPVLPASSSTTSPIS